MGNNSYLLRKEFVHTETIITATVKATPPATVVILDWFLGIPMQKWVYAATLTYTCLQMFFLLYDRLKKYRSKSFKRRGD